MGFFENYPFWFPIRKFDDPVGLWKNFRYLEDFMRGLHAGSGVPTITIAADDSEAISKNRADYICNGTNDHTTIQTAIDSLGANADYRIVFCEGTYNVGANMDFGSGRVSVEGLGLPTFNITLFTGNLFLFAGIGLVYGLRFSGGDGADAFQCIDTEVSTTFLLVDGCVFDTMEGRAVIRPRMHSDTFVRGFVIRNNLFEAINLTNGSGVSPQGVVWSDDTSAQARHGVFTGNRVDGVSFSSANGRVVDFNGSTPGVLCSENMLTDMGGASKIGGDVIWFHNVIHGTYTAGDHTGVVVDHDLLTNVSVDDHHNEAHSVASHNDTTGTGAELETLTDGSDADSLHDHATYLKLDGSRAMTGALDVDQANASGAKPVITLDQADVDEDFFKFTGTSDTNVDRALVDAVDFSTPGAIKGWLKINIEDVQATNPITDGDYYIPFYAVPTT